MNIFGNLALGFAAFIFLVPLQVSLQQPVHTGYRGVGTVLAVLLCCLLFWIPLFASWCVLLAQGGFSWMGIGRPLQLFVMLTGWLALSAITLMSVGLRGDPQLPWALKPFMPWAIYVIPPVMLAATALLLNPGLMARPETLMAGRFVIGICGVVAIGCVVAIATQYAILRAREMERVHRRNPANREKNIRRIISEVEMLDPQKDFAALLMHAGRDRFEEAREAARRKIESHPHLTEALAKMLASDRSQLALGYLEENTLPDLTPLAEPVRQAIERMADWIRRKIASTEPLRHDSFFDETAMVLEVANKFATTPGGADHRAAIRELRAAFESPKTRETYVDAIRLLDDWLREHPGTDSQPIDADKQPIAHIDAQ
jgi:hypothetical protein